MKNRIAMTIKSLTILSFLAIMAIVLAYFSSSKAWAQQPLAANSEMISQAMPEIEESPAADSGQTAIAETNGRVTVKNLWKKFVNRYQIASLKVKILVVIIIYLLFSLVLLFIFIIINRTIKTRERKQAKNIRETYQEELTSYLFGEENQVFEFTGINHSFNRDIFINELLSLHNNLYGEAAIRLRDLYFNLDLYKDSLRKIDKRRWDIKAKGFKELAQMDVKDSSRQISKYVSSRNKILRMESQLALVKLNEEDPLFFLDDFKYELTEWEQINILNTLRYHEINIDSFERWMDNSNDSVVMFSVKLAGLFKHIQSWPKVLELLEHENPDVRLVAIKTLDMFEIAENTGPFIEIYMKEQWLEEKKDDAFYNIYMDRNRLAAIHALKSVATADEIPFFEYVLKTEKDFNILKKAVGILLEITPGGPDFVDQAYERADPELRKIIENTKQIAAQ